MIQRICKLLKDELIDNGYEYGFYLNGKIYKPDLELTPQSTKPWYGKEIVFDNELSFIAEYSKEGCEVIEITDSVVVGEPPEFVLSRMEG